jgi:GrpB-like predicted nucleotidyltransferase (UPF0157 family)
VPFPDELVHDVQVHDYDPAWPAEFDRLASELGTVLGPLALTFEHIGSTSVPGLAAKDCIDMMVVVESVDDQRLVDRLTAAGYRLRPEQWNRAEEAGGGTYPKLVFAPPIGARRHNVHVRERTPAARRALLFRDFLRADATARDGWSGFKQRLAQSVPDLFAYGQIKAPAWVVLMGAAERWARETQWEAFR